MKTSRISALCLAAAALALPRTASAETPDKWVTYVESTGSQWVDTGIIGRPNTKIEAKVEWMTLADSAFVACGYYSNNTRFYMCYCNSSPYAMLLSQRTNATVKLVSWESRWETNRVYNYTAAFSATNSAGKSTGTVTVDGISGWSNEYTGLNTGRSLYVFANNSKDGTVGGKSKTRCYGLKIYQGPEDGGDMELVRDFQPCIKDGKPGLYDTLNDVFYSSISGTELVCDENSEVPDEYIEYVESQGVAAEKDGQIPAYIDTGIIGKAETTVEFKETSLERDSNEHCVIGAKDASDRFFMWFHATGYLAGLGYGGTYWRPVTNDITKAGAWNDPNAYKLNYGDTTHAWVSFAEGSQTFSTTNVATGVETLWSSQTISANVNTHKSLYVFARNNNGTADVFSASRLYFLKIWQNDNLVRDFRPCLKNGVAGLYDDVSKRIFYSLGTPLVYNNVRRRSDEPKEVVFVEYIESDGNNTLDTGVPARSGLRAKGEMAWTQEGDYYDGKLRLWENEVKRFLENTWKPNVFDRQWRAYLAAESLITTNKFFMVHEIEGALNFAYGKSGNCYVVGKSSKLTVGTKYAFDVTFTNGVQTFEWDGTGVLSTNIAGSVDTGNNLCLFSSSHWRNRAAARCYGLRIWQDGILVRDFRPCKVDGKGMLYDTVTESIYRPSPDIPESRTGNVVVLDEETPVNYVEYVETDGKVFFDTGVIGKSGTTAEFKETSMQKRSDKEEAFLASYGGSSDSVARCYLWYHAWGATAGLGYGTYYRPKKNNPNEDAADSSDPDVYKLNKGDTTHARVSFAVGSQTFSAIDNATGTETIYSSKTSSKNVNTGRNLYLFAKNDSDAGTPVTPAASRFYWLKIWQGDSDGTNMRLVRKFKPVKLTNGHVVLWDFVENKPYRPQSVTAPYAYTTFPVVGPDGGPITEPFVLIVR